MLKVLFISVTLTYNSHSSNAVLLKIVIHFFKSVNSIIFLSTKKSSPLSGRKEDLRLVVGAERAGRLFPAVILAPRVHDQR